ncbi:MAG: TonB-dependent receptor [Gluconacetobacter sp.]
MAGSSHLMALLVIPGVLAASSIASKAYAQSTSDEASSKLKTRGPAAMKRSDSTDKRPSSKIRASRDTARTDSQAKPEDIMVTGISRREALQKAPVTASVFTRQQLADARVQSVEDLIAMVPNMAISQGESVGTTFVTLRGISQVRNGQSPVAVVVDGVQQMNYRQFTQDLFNLDQIEVLEGPQGDLWGRNAIGGAIIINTKQPTNKHQVDFQGQYGNGGYKVGRISLRGPLVKDRLYYDLNADVRDFDGLLYNVYRDKTVDFQTEYSARGHIKAILTDDLVADFRAGIDEVRGGALNAWYQGTKLQPGTCNPSGSSYSSSTFSADHVYDTFCANNGGLNTRDIRDASFRLTYTQPWGRVTNTLGWMKLNEYFSSDNSPYTAALDGTQSQWRTNTSWEDELRVTSSDRWKIKWMFGGYFLDERDFLSTTSATDTGQGIARVSTTPLFGYAPNPTNAFFANSDHNQDFALFGHLSYDILKNLTADFGFRYDWNDLSQYVSPDSTAGVPDGCSASDGATCKRERWFRQAQPKGTLSYRLTPQVTFYVDYGIGFRSGQFNQSGTAAAVGLPGAYDVVKPERANTVDVGFKTSWLHDKLRINGSFFDTRDHNSFFFLFNPSVNAQILVNIDQVHLTGGELSATYNPLPGLSFFANLGYTHSSITKYSYNPSAQGDAAPVVPEYTVFLGTQYEHKLFRGVNGFGRFDMTSTGKEYWDPENTTARSAFNLYNFQLGLTAANKKWRFVGWVKNVTNKRYNSEYDSYGWSYAAEPRTYGGSFTVSF